MSKPRRMPIRFSPRSVLMIIEQGTVRAAQDGRSVRFALIALFTFLMIGPSAAWAGVTEPTNLVATAVSTSQIRLTWSDSNTTETGFAIERSLNGTSFTALAQ